MTNPTSPRQPGQSADYPPGPGSPTNPPQLPPPGHGGPPKKSGNKVVWIILAVVIGGTIALCGLGGILAAISPTTTTTVVDGGAAPPDAPDAPEAPDEPAPPDLGTTKDNPAPIGTEVEVAKGFPIKVTAATMDADAEMAEGNQFNKPEAGKQYVIVDLTVTNNTGKPTSIGQHMKLQLLGSSGVAIQQTFFPTPSPELNTTAQMQPGVTVSGRLAYQVPEAELPTVLLLAEPQFTLDTNEDQRFLAIQ